MLPKLTKEEWGAVKNIIDTFYKPMRINHLPLRRRIAESLQGLAVHKIVYGDSTDKLEAIDHHLKACQYYPPIEKDHPTFRKRVGLQV